MVATHDGWQQSAEEPASEIYKVGQNTTRLLMSVGDLVVGWLLTRQAFVALKALDAGLPWRRRGVLPGQARGRPVLHR
jgi:hypothetical protein